MTSTMLDMLPWCLAMGEVGHAPSQDIPTTIFTGVLMLVIEVGLALILLGIGLCLVRLLRGPELADRIVAGDTIALQVVGLVILLTVRLGSDAYIDVAMTVAVIGFVTAIAFSQFIIATHGKEPA